MVTVIYGLIIDDKGFYRQPNHWVGFHYFLAWAGDTLNQEIFGAKDSESINITAIHKEYFRPKINYDKSPIGSVFLPRRSPN